jgi:hypothetical protein
MSVNSDDLSKALSNLALIGDDHPKHTGNVTNKVETLQGLLNDGNMNEAFFLLATYCFDVSKRLAMLHVAIANICATGTPSKELAQLIVTDDTALNQGSLTWEDRATIAGAQLYTWHTRSEATRHNYIQFALDL